MKHSKSLISLSLFALVLALGCAPAEEPAEDEMDEVEVVEAPAETAVVAEASVATATLATADGTEVGHVTFIETPAGVQVSADLHDVAADDGLHGFHVHQTGECSPPDFTTAGDHFDPEGVDHACPPTTPRHAGDLGNVSIAGGSGLLDLTTDGVTVAPGDTSVVGKAVILHEGEDDCTTQPTGDAGNRLACGVVEVEGGGMGDMGEDEAMNGEGEEGY